MKHSSVFRLEQCQAFRNSFLHKDETMRYLIALLVMISVLAMLWLFAQAPDPLHGTWKLNIGKSKWSPNEVTPRSGTTTFEVTQDSIRAVVDGIDAQGRVTHAEYTAKFDGKDYPWKGTIDGKPNLGQDAVTWQRINSHTFVAIGKLKGQVLTTQRTVVAPDGKSRTNTVTGKTAQGQVLNVRAVYEKQ